MLGSALPATATLHTTTSSATPTSPARASRLRGLTYLRNYTYNHLHSSSSRDAPPLSRSASSTAIPDAATSQQQRQQSSSSSTGREESTIQSGENGWLPTVQGRSGLRRESLNPTSTTESASPERSNAGMTRSRASQTLPGPSPAIASTSRRPVPQGEDARSNSMPEAAQANGTNLGPPETSTNGTAAAMPTIRLIPHLEVRAPRPSLQFTAISRTLEQHNSIVRVGRYSERENTALPANTSTAPVGFKSKVVSRRHCEFWCTNGQWYVKDVKSSSGTFLNHVRLSPPGVESFPYPVNDGDVVQLGMDFKGGEEVIFRCVKIRIECNRGWQKGLNNYNKNAHKHLFKKAAVNGSNKKNTKDSADSASTSTSECSICLNPVAPCQALFVAPCSHVWHYKCVKNLIHGPNWPNFLCPNCRFVADLEADVETTEDFDEVAEEEDTGQEEDEEDENGNGVAEQQVNEAQVSESNGGVPVGADLAGMMEHTSLDTDSDEAPPPPSSSSHHIQEGGSGPNSENKRGSINASTSPVPIGAAATSATDIHPTNNPDDTIHRARSLTPTSTAPFSLAVGVQYMNNQRRESETHTPNGEGPMTPRNDAGPFVMNGNARGWGRYAFPPIEPVAAAGLGGFSGNGTARGSGPNARGFGSSAESPAYGEF